MEKIGGSAKIKKIAITGIVASGKSTLCKILAKDKGAYVINSDEVVHQLYSQNQELQKQIVETFGKELLSQGIIDRKKLGLIVFSDRNKLKKLEQIVHPYVIDAIKDSYNQVKDQGYTAFVVEIPLAFEIGFERWFDKIVVVAAEEEVCRSRFDALHGKGLFDQRMKYQWPQSEKIGKATLVVKNDGSIQHLKSKADQCLA